MASSPSRVVLAKTELLLLVARAAASGRAEEAIKEATLNCWVLDWSRKSWNLQEDVTVSTISLHGGLTPSGQSATRSGQRRVLEGQRASPVIRWCECSWHPASPGKAE